YSGDFVEVSYSAFRSGLAGQASTLCDNRISSRRRSGNILHIYLLRHLRVRSEQPNGAWVAGPDDPRLEPCRRNSGCSHRRPAGKGRGPDSGDEKGPRRGRINLIPHELSEPRWTS